MTSERDIERVLDHWFADGPTQVADRVLDEVADRIARQPQQPAWRGSRRDSHVNTYLKPLLAVAAVLVIAVVGWNLMPGGSTRIGGPQSTESQPPTPSPAPSPTPSSTPRPARMDCPAKPCRGRPLSRRGGQARAVGPSPTARGSTPPPGSRSQSRAPSTSPTPVRSGSARCRYATSPADVVAALQARDDLVVSDAIDTTLGGYSGTRVDVQAPADLSACDGQVFIFAEPDGRGVYGGPSSLVPHLDPRRGGSPDRLLDHELPRDAGRRHGRGPDRSWTRSSSRPDPWADCFERRGDLALEVPALLLLALDRLEQSLEVADAEAA